MKFLHADGLDALSDDELNTLFGKEVLHHHCPIAELQSHYIQWESGFILRYLSIHVWERHRDGSVIIEHPGGQAWGIHKTSFCRAAVIALLRHSRIENKPG